MTAGYTDSTDSQTYMMSPNMNPGLYDGGTSSESSASSPLNVSNSLALILAHHLTLSTGLRDSVWSQPVHAISSVSNAISHERGLPSTYGIDSG
jgi:hypothetical protein